MKYLSALLILFLINFNGWASGTYKSNSGSSGSPVPAAPAPRGTNAEITPTKKTEKRLKRFLYGLPRDGVSISNIFYQGENFKVEGNYEKESQLQSFVEKIKGKGSVDRKIKVETAKRKFAGLETKTYVIKGLNLW